MGLSGLGADRSPHSYPLQIFLQESCNGSAVQDTWPAGHCPTQEQSADQAPLIPVPEDALNSNCT